MSNLLVDAHDLQRSYGSGASSVVAVSRASCTVQVGARIALVGPSGSGKSTLLQLLGGLDAPDGGQIVWPALGSRAELRPAKVAYVFQTPSLLPALSVVENVALPLLLLNVDPARAHLTAGESLARLQLAHLADRLPEELSGGQAQRVAVARALVASPRLILADEPTGQLDHATAGQLLDALFAALVGTDTALLVATHDPAVAARLAHRWQMQHGYLEV